MHQILRRVAGKHQGAGGHQTQLQCYPKTRQGVEKVKVWGGSKLKGEANLL
jgi:hypothetical protein